MPDAIREYLELCVPGQLLYVNELAKMFNISTDEAAKHLQDANYLLCACTYCPICRAITITSDAVSDEYVCSKCGESINGTLAKRALMYRKRMPSKKEVNKS